MKDNFDKAPLIVNSDEMQFEMEVDGQTAFVEYVIRDNKIHLTHTEVPTAIQGRGIATALVQKVLPHIKKEKLVVIPSCSFVADYINNHPEWHSLLSEGYQM